MDIKVAPLDQLPDGRGVRLEVAGERIAPRDQEFLRVYFEALERTVCGRAREQGR